MRVVKWCPSLFNFVGSLLSSRNIWGYCRDRIECKSTNQLDAFGSSFNPLHNLRFVSRIDHLDMLWTIQEHFRKLNVHLWLIHKLDCLTFQKLERISLLDGQKLEEIFIRAYNWMLNQIVQEYLETILSLHDDIRVILIECTSQCLLRYIFDNAPRMLDLKDLYQPLKIAVSPIDQFFIFRVIFQKSLDTVLAEFPKKFIYIKTTYCYPSVDQLWLWTRVLINGL